MVARVFLDGRLMLDQVQLEVKLDAVSSCDAVSLSWNTSIVIEEAESTAESPALGKRWRVTWGAMGWESAIVPREEARHHGHRLQSSGRQERERSIHIVMLRVPTANVFRSFDINLNAS